MTTKKKSPLDGFKLNYEEMPLKKPKQIKTSIIKTYLKYLTEVILA